MATPSDAPPARTTVHAEPADRRVRRVIRGRLARLEPQSLATQSTVAMFWTDSSNVVPVQDDEALAESCPAHAITAARYCEHAPFSASCSQSNSSEVDES